ncbi:Rab family GTPase [Colwellia sp. 1_MG-2023]|uniref:Rab family GTPase n=1 Tax=Colwellia sp. 1_MG-2023 TaxID=3062649 RepID=UPI0026E431B2|nr:Rab family GTPase [Colwellia sp. 1_MG-2023]MDO6446608.1 Rab family GTPase [Colwellia sp. 1_MG-2023]
MIQKKICLLGASSVGKTSLVKQFVEGIFNEKYLTSIGVKVDKKVVNVAQQAVQLMLWDIEGYDRYNVFQDKYLRGAAAYIIVVDQTRSTSLIEGLEIHSLAQKANNVPAILAINKSDLQANWHLEDSKTIQYQTLFNAHFNTSAKNGSNVEEMFQAIAALTLQEQ